MAEIRNTGSEFRTRSLTLAVLNVSAFETIQGRLEVIWASTLG